MKMKNEDKPGCLLAELAALVQRVADLSIIVNGSK